MTHSIELISFDLCPFVQRSAILLAEKGIPFVTTYIDLSQKPEWFLQISPLGKVPTLRIGDTVLFESMVIAEYLDEVYPPSLHPTDLLQKAKNRAWAEYSSTLFMDLYNLCLCQDEGAFTQLLQQFNLKLSRLEEQITIGPYFNGHDPKIIDFCIAPLFQRMELIEGSAGPALSSGYKNLSLWSKHLLERPSVQSSVPEQFDQKYISYIQKQDGVLAAQLTPSLQRS